MDNADLKRMCLEQMGIDGNKLYKVYEEDKLFLYKGIEDGRHCLIEDFSADNITMQGKTCGVMTRGVALSDSSFRGAVHEIFTINDLKGHSVVLHKDANEYNKNKDQKYICEVIEESNSLKINYLDGNSIKLSNYDKFLNYRGKRGLTIGIVLKNGLEVARRGEPNNGKYLFKHEKTVKNDSSIDLVFNKVEDTYISLAKLYGKEQAKIKMNQKFENELQTLKEKYETDIIGLKDIWGAQFETFEQFAEKIREDFNQIFK